MPESHTLSSLRIVADSTGLSRFEDYERKLHSADFSPPAPPMQVSEFEAATRYVIARAPGGWFGDWHPTPRRQIAILLAGWVEVEVGNGERRIFSPGSTTLLEDTTGKGHTTRVIGPDDAVLMFVQLE